MTHPDRQPDLARLLAEAHPPLEQLQAELLRPVPPPAEPDRVELRRRHLASLFGRPVDRAEAERLIAFEDAHR